MKDLLFFSDLLRVTDVPEFGWKSGHRSPNSGFHFRPRRLGSPPHLTLLPCSLHRALDSANLISHSQRGGGAPRAQSQMSFFFSSRSGNGAEQSRGESSGSMTAVLKSKWVSFTPPSSATTTSSRGGRSLYRVSSRGVEEHAPSRRLHSNDPTQLTPLFTTPVLQDSKRAQSYQNLYTTVNHPSTINGTRTNFSFRARPDPFHAPFPDIPKRTGPTRLTSTIDFKQASTEVYPKHCSFTAVIVQGGLNDVRVPSIPSVCYQP